MIKDAYLELPAKDPNRRVSVTDICKHADLNRSTFYAHYEDADQLQREMEDDILEQIPVLIDMPDELSSDEKLIDTVLEKYRVAPSGPSSFLSECDYVFIVSGTLGLMGARVEEGFPVSDRKLAHATFRLSDSTEGVLGNKK